MKYFALLVILSALAAPLQAETYQIDEAHSSISFRIRHLVSKTKGRFGKFEGSYEYTPGKADAWKTSAKIDPASIDTGNAKRDAHLKAPDFFDVAKCPEMGFKSTKVSVAKDGKAQLVGELTMHCVSKPISLDLEEGGVADDPMGKGKRSGFTATGKLARKDFGISWDKVPGMLGEDVEISIEIEGVAQAAGPKK